MDYLSNLNFEQLGTAGIIIAILLWQNLDQRKTIKELQDYSRTTNQLFQDSMIQYINAFRDLQEAIQVLSALLRERR